MILNGKASQKSDGQVYSGSPTVGFEKLTRTHPGQTPDAQPWYHFAGGNHNVQVTRVQPSLEYYHRELIRIPLFEVCETKNRCRGFNSVFFTERSPGRVFQKALAGKFWPGPILSQSLWCPTFRNSTRDEQISGLEPIPKRNQSLHFRIGFSFLSCDHTKAPQFNVAQKLPRSSVRMREL